MNRNELYGLIWVAVAIAAGVVEVFTLDLIFLMVAGGALVAAAGAAVTGSLTLSLLMFAVATVFLLLGGRPPLRAYMQRNVPSEPMHTEALLGRRATVVQQVDDSSGRIRLGGELWSARLAERMPPVAAGTSVYVVRIDGATAVVAVNPPLAAGTSE